MPRITVIIDDDADDILFLREAILQIDGSVLCHDFDSPLQAISTLSQEGSVIPDYVFIDFNMPHLNGLECLLQLKQLRRLANTKYIINSTSMDDKLKKKFLSHGAFFVFQKPYQASSYLKILKQVLLNE